MIIVTSGGFKGIFLCYFLLVQKAAKILQVFERASASAKKTPRGPTLKWIWRTGQRCQPSTLRFALRVDVSAHGESYDRLNLVF